MKGATGSYQVMILHPRRRRLATTEHARDGRPAGDARRAGGLRGVRARHRAATEPPLRRALVAAYGYEDGREAAAEALAYAWEHWARVREMPNAAGYLFRVARSSVTRGRRWRRRPPPLLTLPPGTEHRFEPGLPAALAALSERQRLEVVLVYGFGYKLVP